MTRKLKTRPDTAVMTGEGCRGGLLLGWTCLQCASMSFIETSANAPKFSTYMYKTAVVLVKVIARISII